MLSFFAILICPALHGILRGRYAVSAILRGSEDEQVSLHFLSCCDLNSYLLDLSDEFVVPMIKCGSYKWQATLAEYILSYHSGCIFVYEVLFLGQHSDDTSV